MVRYGTPKGPTARESSELIAHGESSELNPLIVDVGGGRSGTEYREVRHRDVTFKVVFLGMVRTHKGHSVGAVRWAPCTPRFAVTVRGPLLTLQRQAYRRLVRRDMFAKVFCARGPGAQVGV